MKGIEEITVKLEQGVKDVFNGGQYKEYLDFMAKFHDYSVNNCILILMQMPTASLVAGYKAWQTKFNRQVRKGEKGIQILAPIPHKFRKEVKDENGNVTEKEFSYNTFRAVSVFDISQTDGDKVPTVVNELTEKVADYDSLLKKLIAFAPVPVGFEDIQGGAKGYYNRLEKRIAIKSGMAEQQTVKTLVHEIARSMLHSVKGEESEADRQTKEVQAESVAYVVCSQLGLSTDDYSFGYIATWGGDKEAKQLINSMEIIKKTATMIIEGMGA